MTDFERLRVAALRLRERTSPAHLDATLHYAVAAWLDATALHGGPTTPEARRAADAILEDETPPASTPPEPEPETCGKRSTWQRWGGILGPCVKPPGHETDEWHLDARGSAWAPVIDAHRSTP